MPETINMPIKHLTAILFYCNASLLKTSLLDINLPNNHEVIKYYNDLKSAIEWCQRELTQEIN